MSGFLIQTVGIPCARAAWKRQGPNFKTFPPSIPVSYRPVSPSVHAPTSPQRSTSSVQANGFSGVSHHGFGYCRCCSDYSFFRFSTVGLGPKKQHVKFVCHLGSYGEGPTSVKLHKLTYLGYSVPLRKHILLLYLGLSFSHSISKVL